ncbi:neurofilament medium polypeptide-like [Arapaima gigas]
MPTVSSRLGRSHATQQKDSIPGATDALFPIPSSRVPSPANANEEETLQELNKRFAKFTKKVRGLEAQNNVLKKELEECRQKSASAPPHVSDPEIHELRRFVHEVIVEKQKIKVEQQHLEEEIRTLREKCAAEVQLRSETEGRIMTLKKVVNDACLSKTELDKKAQFLVEDKIILRNVHQDNMAEMMMQLKTSRVSAEVRDFGKTDISTALQDLRKECEVQASEKIQQSGEHLHAGMARLPVSSEMNKEAVKVQRGQMNEQRRQLQSKNVELEMAKCTKKDLENQLSEAEEQLGVEISHYQDTIQQLEEELKHTKHKLSSHLTEYQALLNVKMELDTEISSYRKLLDNEEAHISLISALQPSAFLLLPVCNLQHYPKEKSPTAETEPQYNLAEEIITETTKEDEITEGEENESKGMWDEEDSAETKKGSGQEAKDREQCDVEVTPPGDVLQLEETPKDTPETKYCETFVSTEGNDEKSGEASKHEPDPQIEETEDTKQTEKLPKGAGAKTENREVGNKGTDSILATLQTMKQDLGNLSAHVNGASTEKAEEDKRMNEKAAQLPN